MVINAIKEPLSVKEKAKEKEWEKFFSTLKKVGILKRSTFENFTELFQGLKRNESQLFMKILDILEANNQIPHTRAYFDFMFKSLLSLKGKGPGVAGLYQIIDANYFAIRNTYENLFEQSSEWFQVAGKIITLLKAEGIECNTSNVQALLMQSGAQVADLHAIQTRSRVLSQLKNAKLLNPSSLSEVIACVKQVGRINPMLKISNTNLAFQLILLGIDQHSATSLTTSRLLEILSHIKDIFALENVRRKLENATIDLDEVAHLIACTHLDDALPPSYDEATQSTPSLKR